MQSYVKLLGRDQAEEKEEVCKTIFLSNAAPSLDRHRLPYHSHLDYLLLSSYLDYCTPYHSCYLSRWDDGKA